MDKVFIRLLEETDAAVSWKWRNDPKVWKYTGRKPDNPITYAIELEWIKKVLQRQNEIRFAICEKETGNYIGNVQLTDINGYDAAFHIFIGDKKSWGRGYGTEATRLMLKYGFNVLKLQSIWLDVKKENKGAIKAYEKAGFLDVFDYNHYRRMAVYESDKIEKKISVFVITYNHEKFIGETLEGILNQHINVEFEIVVGDDFSKDTTRSILLNYAIKYPGKFKLLFYPRNISAAINQIWVLKNCSGKYIAMCEGDDFWKDPLKLQLQFDFLEKNNDFVLSFHDIVMIDTEGKSIEQDRLLEKDKKDYEKDELLVGAYLPTPTLFFKQFDIAKHIANFSKAFNGDSLLLSILTQKGKTKFLPKIEGSAVRVHSGGVWSSITYLDRWNHSLNTLQIIFGSLNSKKQGDVFEHYNKVFEMAIWDADYYEAEKYWMEYSKQYISFLIRAKQYGKTWLVLRRILKRTMRRK